MHWEGIYCALWLPTDASGRVIETELKTIMDFARSQGVHGWFALGSTGQFLLLTPEERRRTISLVARLAGGLPVVVNVSDLQTGVMADLGACCRTEGAAGVAVLPPWYFPVPDADQTEYFVDAGNKVQLPLCLYNFPERTGNRISLETIAAVADRVPVAAIKQSGADFDYHRPLVELGRKKNFAVFSGADERLPETVPLGVRGCVSGFSNAVPELLASIFEALRDGEPQRASQPAARLCELAVVAESLVFPLNVAAVMEGRGLPVGIHKWPMSHKTRALYDQLVRRSRALFEQWELPRP